MGCAVVAGSSRHSEQVGVAVVRMEVVVLGSGAAAMGLKEMVEEWGVQAVYVEDD